MAFIRPTRPDPNQFVPITIFPNGGGGFGFASTSRGMRNTVPEGYDKTINCVVEGGLRIVPVPRAEAILGVFLFPVRATNAVAWKSSSNAPIVLHLVDRSTAVNAIVSIGNIVQSESTPLTSGLQPRIVLHDNGSGTAFLYAADNTTLRRRDNAGNWTSPTTDIPAKHLAVVAGDLWRSIGTNEVSKCPLGSDPFTLSNWTSAIKVGSSDAEILRLDGIGSALIVFKEDGIWSYDEQNARFLRVYALPRSSEHFPFTCPDGQGGLITSTAFGAILRLLRFGTVLNIRPATVAAGAYTPRGKIVDAVLYEDKVYALMQAGEEWRTAGAGITVRGWDGTQYVDITTTVTDADPSYATVTFTDTEGLLVGADVPLVGVHISPGTPSAGNPALRLFRRDGTSLYTELKTIDGTRRMVGAIAKTLQAAGPVYTYEEAHNQRALHVKVEDKYWLKVISSTTFTAQITEVRALPWLPGAPSYPVVYGGSGARNVWNAAISVNIGTWVLVGTITSSGELVWDTTYAFPGIPAANIAVWDRIGVNDRPLLRVTTMSSGTILDSDLLTSVYHLPLIPNNAPSSSAFAGMIKNSDLTERGMVPTFFPSTALLDGIYELRYVEVFGKRFWKESGNEDKFALWAGMNDLEWSPPIVQVADEYVQFEFPPGLAGSELRLALSIYMGTDTRARTFPPQIDAITAWVKPVAPYVPRSRETVSV